MYIDVGKSIPIFKGDYDSETTYSLNDVVRSDNMAYWHMGESDTTGISPSNTLVWTAVADLGDMLEMKQETAQIRDEAFAAKTAAEQASVDISEAVEAANKAGVASAELDSNYHLILNMKDGTTLDVGYVRGEKGEQGATGASGAKGAKGDATVVTSVELVSGDHSPGTSDTYRVTFDNGTTFDFDVYNGLNGTGSVSTVNGISPDSSGNVEIDTAGGTVKTVNSVSPDDSGNVTLDIPGGTVTSVNGVSPDTSGNVDIEAISGHVTTVSETYTITSEDVGGTILANNSTTVIYIRCPNDEDIAIGSVVTVLNTGTGTVTITAGSGVTLALNKFEYKNSGFSIVSAYQYSPITLTKTGDTEWAVSNGAFAYAARSARILSTTTVGDESTPVYFSAGVPVATTGVVKTVNDTAPDENGNVAIDTSSSGFSIDTLWTNSDSSSAFASQTISLASGYKLFIVVATTTFDSFASYTAVVMPASNTQMIERHSGDGDASILGYRNVVSGEDSIYFGSGYATLLGNAPAQANTILVPKVIYGIK